VYGLPSVELEQAVREGRVVLGGCIITGNDPQEKCIYCGAKFLKKI